MAETAAALVSAHARPELPGERLRNAILARLDALAAQGFDRAEALQELYPSTLLDVATLEAVTAALVSGSNLLLLGPPGSGKTSLAKDIWSLFPKDALVVADCPVQDDPFSLIDAEFAKRVPPCPYCKSRHGHVLAVGGGDFDARKVSAKDVPVRRTELREGYGLARLQGSPEVFPDYLTGAVNLAKLEEIGDPNSPLVLEPGKLMQANRGLLLVDEVGKLPRGTQNVLLQAFQENIVTPSKSRETFPASFVAITTSNTEDLDTINEPLTGRLTSVFVGFNEDHDKNRLIVDRALVGHERAHVSGPLREAAVLLIERWRRTSEGAIDLAEVGSNRTLVDILRRAEAHAALRGEAETSAEDYERGAAAAMRGRVRGRSGESYFQNRDAVDAFLAKQGKVALAGGAVAYWCGFYVDALKEDKSEGERVVREVRDVLADNTRAERALGDEKAFPKFSRWAAYVEAREGKTNGASRVARQQAVFAILDAAKAFDADAKK
ncbi:MAG: ATP-binding protein [Thermoplasmatota archaeon]